MKFKQTKMVEPIKPMGSIEIPAPGSNTMAYYQPPKDVLNTKIDELLGNEFYQKKGSTEREREEGNLKEDATCEMFEGLKFVGLFFSMENCPPCKMMLQNLKNFYTDVNLEERQFEIVLVSSDDAEDDFNQHYSTMPWMSLKYHRTTDATGNQIDKNCNPKCDELRNKF